MSDQPTDNPKESFVSNVEEEPVKQAGAHEEEPSMGDVGKSLRAMTLMLETLTGRLNAVESKSIFDDADRQSEVGEVKARASRVTQRKSQ